MMRASGRAPTQCPEWRNLLMPLSWPGQHQREIVRLLAAADPVAHRLSDLIRYPAQRQVPVLAHQLHQPLLTKFAKLILRFGNTVAVGYENVARTKLNFGFLEGEVVEQADNRPSAGELAQRAVGRQDERRQVPGVGIAQRPGVSVVSAQKQRGVLFRRS